MINQINYKEFYNKFMSTLRGQQIKEEYDIVYSEPNLLKYYQHTGHNVLGVSQWEVFGTTPREISGNQNLTNLRVEHEKKRLTSFSITPFYYLAYLEELNPTTIADIGCGWNIFKKYIPSIIGWDVNGEWADHNQPYNEKFRKDYFGKFDCAFSINAVSAPTWVDIKTSINEFLNIVRPRGRIFLSFPAVWLYQNTSYQWYVDNGLTLDDPDGISKWVYNDILSLGQTILVFDSNINLNNAFLSHDGDLRIVIEKTS
jgi:hypothetical protein